MMMYTFSQHNQCNYVSDRMWVILLVNVRVNSTLMVRWRLISALINDWRADNSLTGL